MTREVRGTDRPMSGKVHAVAHAASEEQRMSRRDILFSTLIRRECSALETLDG